MGAVCCARSSFRGAARSALSKVSPATEPNIEQPISEVFPETDRENRTEIKVDTTYSYIPDPDPPALQTEPPSPPAETRGGTPLTQSQAPDAQPAESPEPHNSQSHEIPAIVFDLAKGSPVATASSQPRTPPASPMPGPEQSLLHSPLPGNADQVVGEQFDQPSANSGEIPFSEFADNRIVFVLL